MMQAWMQEEGRQQQHLLPRNIGTLDSPGDNRLNREKGASSSLLPCFPALFPHPHLRVTSCKVSLSLSLLLHTRCHHHEAQKVVLSFSLSDDSGLLESLFSRRARELCCSFSLFFELWDDDGERERERERSAGDLLSGRGRETEGERREQKAITARET